MRSVTLQVSTSSWIPPSHRVAHTTRGEGRGRLERASRSGSDGGAAGEGRTRWMVCARAGCSWPAPHPTPSAAQRRSLPTRHHAARPFCAAVAGVGETVRPRAHPPPFRHPLSPYHPSLTSLSGERCWGPGHVQEPVPLQSWAMLMCILLVSTLNQWARQLFVYMSTVSTAAAGATPPGFFNLRIDLGLDVSQYGLLSGTANRTSPCH